MVATIGAIASLVGAGSQLAGTLMSNQGSSKEANQLAYQQLADAESNANYQRLLNTLATQRSVSGYQDPFGSTMTYDPATNTWRTTLGKLPMAADTSALLATIARNTTDQEMQRFANEQAMNRAAQAGPVADRALRDYASYQPVSANALTGLLTQQAATGSANAYRDVLADTLRQYARSGTAAAPAIASIGGQAAKSLRDAMVNAQLTGMTGAADINKANLANLGGNATTAASLANPSLTFPGIAGSEQGKTLANMQAAQQRTAAFAPVYGGQNINQALGAAGTATGQAMGSIPSSNFDATKVTSAGTQLGDLFKEGQPLNKWLSGLFGGGGGGGGGATVSSTQDPYNAYRNTGQGDYTPYVQQYNF